MIQSNRQNHNTSFASSFANSIVQQTDRTPAKNTFLRNTSTFCPTASASQTEAQIYSHSLIRQIMEERQRNTIRHDINKVEENTQLFKMPLKFNPKQFQFNAIPAENQMFSSLCSVTLKNINQGLSSQRVKNTHVNDKKINHKQDQVVKNPRISASGLASFKFSSVKAKQSLGIGRINYDEIMRKQIQQNRKRLSSANQRNNRILQRRTSDHKYKTKAKRENQIVAIKNISTSHYLKNVQKINEESSKIFNQNIKKTNYIKQYMNKQKVQFDEASHAINVIEQMTKPKQNSRSKPIQKAVNIDQLFESRKMPVKRHSIQVKSFYFIE